MKPLVLFEDDGCRDLLPLLYWRSVFELRVGRKIQLDRIAQRLGLPVGGVWTRDRLAPVAAQRCGAPANVPLDGPAILANGRWVFDDDVTMPSGPKAGMIGDELAFLVCDAALASRIRSRDLLDPICLAEILDGIDRIDAPGKLVRYPWDIVCDLKSRLECDWSDEDAIVDAPLDSAALVGPKDRLHIGQRTVIHPTAVIDAAGGPIFISHDVRIGPFAVVEGPAYIGPGTEIRPHAWLHGANAVGPLCKLGGEIDGCVIHGYTNKQHQGFLGHALVGSWVNLGAGSTNSDLKNTYGHVRVPINGVEVDSGERFFGAVIGDHVKIGINATLPTGAVIGMGATVATTSVLPKFTPSFAWVTDRGVRRGDSARLLDVASVVMARRGIDMTDEEIELFLDLDAQARAAESEASLVYLGEAAS